MKKNHNFYLVKYFVILCLCLTSFASDTQKYLGAKSHEKGENLSIYCFDKLIGSYRYCINGVDNVRNCYTLVIFCKNKENTGIIFGPRPDPDHGMYYFLSNIKRIQVKDSLIEFDFSFDHIYSFPVTEKNYTHLNDSISGGESTSIYLKGVLRQNTINVSCIQCEDELDFTSMNFRKK